LILHLPGEGKYEHQGTARQFVEYVNQFLPLDPQTTNFVLRIAEARELTLRPLEKILTYVSLAVAFTTSKNTRYFRPAPILAGLCVLKALEPSLFQKAKSRRLALDEAFNAFRISAWPSDHLKKSALMWWQFALDPNVDFQQTEWQSWISANSEFSIERRDVVRLVSENVIDRMQLPDD
jgi:hypothetical protein